MPSLPELLIFNVCLYERFCIISNRCYKIAVRANLNGTIFNLRMTEDELLRFNSAMVDAATLGARLYTTRYVERMLRMQKPNLPMSLQMPKQTRQKLQILQKLPVLIQQSKESNAH